MKDPVKPNAKNGAPIQPTASKPNYAPVIIIVVLFVFVGVPIAFIFFIFSFIERHYDDIKGFVNDGINSSIDSFVALDNERQQSVRTIALQAENVRMRDLGVSKKDCENLKSIAALFDDSFVKSSGNGATVCDDDSIRIAAKYEAVDDEGLLRLNDFSTLYISNGSQCAEYDFSGAYTRVFDYKLVSSSKCSGAVSAKIIDTGESVTPFNGQKVPYHNDTEDFSDDEDDFTSDRA